MSRRTCKLAKAIAAELDGIDHLPPAEQLAALLAAGMGTPGRDRMARRVRRRRDEGDCGQRCPSWGPTEFADLHRLGSPAWPTRTGRFMLAETATPMGDGTAAHPGPLGLAHQPPAGPSFAGPRRVARPRTGLAAAGVGVGGRTGTRPGCCGGGLLAGRGAVPLQRPGGDQHPRQRLALSPGHADLAVARGCTR